MCVLCVIAYKDTHPPLLYNTKETGISQWLQVSSAEPSLISVILMLHMMPACMETHGLNGELRSSWLLWQVTDTVFLLTVSDPWDSDMNLTCFTLARVTLIRVLDILYFPFQEFLIIDWRDVGMAVASPIILFLFFWVLWPIQKCRDKKILMAHTELLFALFIFAVKWAVMESTWWHVLHLSTRPHELIELRSLKTKLTVSINRLELLLSVNG